jgi:putative glycosyltransferase
MKLSIVSTLYQSSPYIDEFIRRVSVCAQQITEAYEIILVNDGSPDDSLHKALIAQRQDTHLKIVDLSRNFGHHEAGMAGLEQALGEFVFLIDSDLEENPELLLQFWSELTRKPEVDVIYGIQEQRKGGWFEQFSGYLFYIIFNKLSPIKIATNALTVRLMKKHYVDAITQYQERNLFVAGIMAHAGFNQQSLVVTKKSKQSSTYTLAKRLKLFFTSITAFSIKPLEYIFMLGSFIFLLSVAALGYYCLDALLFKNTISTVQVITLATGFIIGSLMSCTGLLGLYLAPIAIEIKQRPRVIIKKIYASTAAPE